MEILLDALLGTNNSPLKAALLAEKLGADIDMGFDDSTLQPTLELVLRGATEESARKFAPAVRKAVDDVLARGIPQELWDDALALLPEGEEAIERFIRSKCKGKPLDRETQRKLAAALQRRGFSWQEIRPVLNRLGEEMAEE